jgi:hypothetical protein
MSNLLSELAEMGRKGVLKWIENRTTNLSNYLV